MQHKSIEDICVNIRNFSGELPQFMFTKLVNDLINAEPNIEKWPDDIKQLISTTLMMMRVGNKF